MSDAPLQPAQEPSLSQVVHELATQRGLDLRGYKQGTLQRRMHKRMHQLGIHSYSEYLRLVEADPSEVPQLLAAVLINVTEFFRDPSAWELLRTSFLPWMLARVGSGETFRAWCPGCASGEEAYSLAILLAEYFGDRLPERDIKIYATDIDDDALNTARRGEYPRDRLRRLRPEWREKYFRGDGSTVRIFHDVRRLVVFGRGNLLADAPISHCQLVLCRNVLIYFDKVSQQQILKRLHHALDPNGVLFLGKAESVLTDAENFRAINARWRIFQKVSPAALPGGEREDTMPDASNHQFVEELRQKRLEQGYILESLTAGVIVLDSHDTVATHNDAALQIWGVGAERLSGLLLQKTEIAARCPELLSQLEAARHNSEPIRFQCSIRPEGTSERLIAVSLRPMLAENGQRTGTLMHCEDVTPQEKLRSTVEQLATTSHDLQSANEELETANEELQSTNEELETTNEELQSTNEELETTNEELQSTNEELETANEELQSLNEELENMNEELEHRTRELKENSERYAQTLHSMPFPVMLIDGLGKVQLWNSAAQNLLGVGSTSVVGVDLRQIPVEDALRNTLVRRCQAVLISQEPGVLHHQRLHKKARESFEVHLSPVSRQDSGIEGVLIVFGPLRTVAAAVSRSAAPTHTGAKRTAAQKATKASATKAAAKKNKRKTLPAGPGSRARKRR